MNNFGNKAPQDSLHFPDAFYRVTVKGLCVRDGKLLMTYDATFHNNDPWELPGGGLDFGENFITALKREVEEEMGLKVTRIDERPVYIWPVKGGPGRGMEWFWCLVVVFRIDFENLDFTPTTECQEIRFFTIDEIKGMLPQVAKQIRPIVDYFDPADFI